MKFPFPLPPLSPRLRAALGFAALALGAADLRAQAVSYVGDISLPNEVSFVLPLNGRHTGSSGTWVMMVSAMYKWNETTNALEPEVGQFSAGFKINSASLPALGRGTGDSDDVLRVFGIRNYLYTFSMVDHDFSFVPVSVAISGSRMLSFGSDSVSVLTMSGASDRLFIVSPSTGVGSDMGIGLVTNVGGTAYGPDGLLYVLDNPNGTYRVQSFDLTDGLDDADRLRGSFSIAASLTSGYEGMAINSAGHLFIADGLGGGTAYDLAGNHLGDFSFTGGGSADTNGLNGQTGASYLNLDDAGNVFVYTPDTGLHHYFDSSYSATAIPEPSTYAALLGVCALALAARRRRAQP